jgi:Tfp pilus assembly PilM family ATPase
VIQILSEAKLGCRILDGFPFAMARAVKLAYPDSQAALTGAIHWGFASATFSIVSDGKPLFTRHLRNCGLASLTDAVGRALNVSEQEAVQLLAEHGLPGPQSPGTANSEIQDVIADVTAEAFKEMVDELNKTVSYVKMQYPDVLPQRYCLLGDGALVNNVTSRLADGVGVAVDTWQLPDAGSDRPHAVDTPPAILATAVALSTLAWTS